MKNIKVAVATMLLGLTVVTFANAAPVVFDFANLEYDGSGTALSDFTGFKPSDGIYCTGGDLCSSSIGTILGDDLTYTMGGLTVHATGFYNDGIHPTKQVAVVQDHENAYNGLLYGATAIGAGLGVYHKSGDTSDDNVTTGEMLKLSFNQVVSFGTLGLRAEGHNTTGWGSTNTFQYSVDNINWSTGILPDNTGAFALNLTSKDFYFRYGGTNADQFYVSSASVMAIPEPETYAMLAAGLSLISFVARRRKQQTVSNRALKTKG